MKILFQFPYVVLSLLIFLPIIAIAQSQPNIILIMADDLGFETLSCNGSISYQTPHLDSLAKTGMRFTNAHAMPLCTPSRVQIMTGKYNFRNYIAFGILDPGEKTFAHMLQAEGYATCVIGKWQLYGNKKQRELANQSGSLPAQAGFDDYCLWQILEKAGPRFKDPFIELPGREGKTYKGKYGPDMFVDYGLDFIKQQKDAGKPFFLYYPMVLTHEPFQPTPDHPDYGKIDLKKVKSDTSYFKANVEYMDKLIGKMVHQLDKWELRENTLILFVGDNGTDRPVVSKMGDKVVAGDKGNPTVYGTHVPMIANWLGKIKEEQVNEYLIDFTDFLPTLRDVSQYGKPAMSALENRSPGGQVPQADQVIQGPIDGLSFFPQLLGAADAPVRRWVFCHYDSKWGRPKRRFIHNTEWKLFENGELYHIKEDPLQQHPIDPKTVDRDVQYLLYDFKTTLESLQ